LALVIVNRHTSSQGTGAAQVPQTNSYCEQYTTLAPICQVPIITFVIFK
jgi:hypothetical protein